MLLFFSRSIVGLTSAYPPLIFPQEKRKEVKLKKIAFRALSQGAVLSFACGHATHPQSRHKGTK